MAGPQLAVKKGISPATVNNIPEDWNAQWFRRFIRDHLQNSDTRNAIAGSGISITGTVKVPATISVGSGTPYVIGDLLYADSATTLAHLNDVAVGSYLRSGGVATPPLWSTLKLPNAATQGDLLFATAANVIGNLADVAPGSFLRSGGVAANPAWSAITVPNGAVLGDIWYASAPGVISALPGNITATRQFLSQTGTSSVSAAPVWVALSAGDIPDLAYVDSVALLDGSTTPIYTISGSPVTDIGTLTFTLATQSANRVFAGPTTGSAAQPTFRALVVADLPTGIPNGNLQNSSVTVSPGTGLSGGGAVSLGGTITLNNTGVTSVALSDGSTTPIYTISGSPVTTTGTLTHTLATQSANQVFAGPTTGAAAQPAFRALVAADVPSSILPGSFSGFANPSASVGLAAVNGVATTAMRSDGAPALSQAINPTWTAQHVFTPGTAVPGIVVNANGSTIAATYAATSANTAQIALGGNGNGSGASTFLIGQNATGVAFLNQKAAQNFIFQSGGVTAMTISTAQAVTFAKSALVIGAATGGIGYGTGAGGTVTQATSRTTGVTLNTICGAITLVSAAGSATLRTFTLTNSQIAATDTIVVNQKSGTDLYEIFVTAVAAGSCNISSFTTGGTTTEQPVFNFAVIKAVTA